MSYLDALSGRTKTWPYGTQKKVKVGYIEEQRRFIMCEDESEKVGYVIIGTDIDGIELDDCGIITFKEGGPLGGYWKFKKEI